MKGGIKALSLVWVLIFVLLGAWSCAKPTPTLTTTPGPTTTSSPASAPIKWRLQNAQGPTSYGVLEFFKPFADEVKAKSGGRLEIEVMPPNAVVSAQEAFTAVNKGLIEATGNVAHFHAKLMPEADIEFGLPITFEDTSSYSDSSSNIKEGLF